MISLQKTKPAIFILALLPLFAFQTSYAEEGYPKITNIEILNGRSELMVANYGSDSISVLKNSIGSAPQVDLTSSNLPIIFISTSGGEEITKEFKIDATMKVVYDSTGGRNLITGPFSDYDGKIGIKGRGSSSWALYPKKGYTLNWIGTHPVGSYGQGIAYEKVGESEYVYGVIKAKRKIVVSKLDRAFFIE